MKNDMKLIMESWRSNALRTKEAKLNEEPDPDEVSDTSGVKIDTLLQMFDQETSKEMMERHNVFKALASKLIELSEKVLAFRGAVGDTTQNFSQESLDKLVEEMKGLAENLIEIFEQTMEPMQQQGSMWNKGWSMVKKGLSSLISGAPDILESVSKIVTNPIVAEVALKAGLSEAIKKLIVELNPAIKLLVKTFDVAKSLGNLFNEDSKFQQAMSAKDPNKAFDMMISAALQIDDDKEAMMGPLKVLNLDDNLVKVIDKKITAEFLQGFIEYIKQNSGKYLKLGAADRMLIAKVKSKGVEISMPS